MQLNEMDAKSQKSILDRFKQQLKDYGATVDEIYTASWYKAHKSAVKKAMLEFKVADKKITTEPKANAKIAKGLQLNIITPPSASTKFAKTTKNVNVHTSSLNLTPHTFAQVQDPDSLRVINFCGSATTCIKSCLATESGQAAICKGGVKGLTGEERMEARRQSSASKSRIGKSNMFVNYPVYFMAMIGDNIRKEKAKQDEEGNIFTFRGNVASDVPFEKFGLYKAFPDILFYDYTKLANRLETKPENLHLTFSYSGPNYADVKKALENGTNVAVAGLAENDRQKGQVPKSLWGYKVVEGDKHDYRPLDDAEKEEDGKGLIVWLWPKGSKHLDPMERAILAGKDSLWIVRTDRHAKSPEEEYKIAKKEAADWVKEQKEKKKGKVQESMAGSMLDALLEGHSFECAYNAFLQSVLSD